MADLATDLGLSLGMHEVGQSPPRGFVFGGVQPGTAGRDTAGGGHAGHLDIDQPGTALGPFGIVGKVPIGRAAVDGFVLGHGRHYDPVG